jgi:hypothetical protein
MLSCIWSTLKVWNVHSLSQHLSHYRFREDIVEDTLWYVCIEYHSVVVASYFMFADFGSKAILSNVGAVSLTKKCVVLCRPE